MITGFSFDISVPVLIVPTQGLLSFLSPCALPFPPFYLSYLAREGKHVGEDGRIHYLRRQVPINTLFFTIGIGFTFFLLGFGFTALGKFFNSNRTIFVRISGIIMAMFGLYQFSFFGGSKVFGKEHQMFLESDRWSVGPIPALLLDFTFSFARTPRAEPVLSSVMLMARTTSSMDKATMLIGVYTLGFTLPFLAAGLFITALLDFFKKHRNVVKYMTKVGATLLILTGIMVFTGFMNSFAGYLFPPDGFSSDSNTAKEQATAAMETSPMSEENIETMPAQSESVDDTRVGIAAVESGFTAEETAIVAPILTPNLILVDQNEETHTLSDYQGKTIFLNFWATWYSPYREGMPEIQALYERYGSNGGDLIALGVTEPNQGQEGGVDHVISFFSEQGYTFPIVMDEAGDVFCNYSIYSYPTISMIDGDGSIFGYTSGILSTDMMESIVKQTMDEKLAPQ